jgi:predicted alpha/beta-hydrolase family hydrolase
MSAWFLVEGPEDARVTILAGARRRRTDGSRIDCRAANVVSASGFRVVRCEFGYMVARRTSADRKPLPRAETLNREYKAAIADRTEPASSGLFLRPYCSPHSWHFRINCAAIYRNGY